MTPFGLVKSVDKDGSTFTLVKIITGATDKITGTPVPFNPMMFMGRGTARRCIPNEPRPLPRR